LDKEFSLKIRARDSAEFDGAAFRCITCRNVKPYEQADCGHYLGRQYWATRWNPMNCASQCRFCNRFNEGLKAKFREALFDIYGAGLIVAMEAGHKKGRKPRDFETALILAEIKKIAA
jgi:hypothetical protein